MMASSRLRDILFNNTNQLRVDFQFEDLQFVAPL